MGYLTFLLVSIGALIAFCILVAFEQRRGVRLFGASRDRLDVWVDRATFIYTHVDLVAFAREELWAIVNRIFHVVAHLVLRAVRGLERLLTRVVRHLRSTAVESEAPRETAREFVRTLSDFKETLDAEHPPVLTVEEKRTRAEDRRRNERRERARASSNLVQ